MKLRALPIAALTLTLAVPMLAQGPGGPEGAGRPGQRGGAGGPRGPEGRRGPGGPRGPLGLLMIPEVQQELKLQATQIEKLSALLPPGGRPEGRPGEGRPGGGERPQGAGRPGGERPGAGRPGGERPRGEGRPEGGRGERGGMNRDWEKQLAGLLDEKQLARFKQLELQQAGARAASRPEIAASLKLSAEQQEKVRAAVEAERAAMRELFEGPRGEGTGDPRRKAEAVRKNTETQLDALLNDAQKKQLREMQGAPFTFPTRREGGPRGEGRPGQGRPGQGRPGQGQ